MNVELPKDWKIVKFSDYCKNLSLNKIKIKQRDYLSEGKLPVVDQGQDLIGGYYNDERFLVPDIPPYIIFGDHTKVKKFIPFKFVAGADGVKVLKPHSDYNPKFFYYLLFVIKIPDKGYARHFQFIENASIPLPPLPEQNRIVSKIEELFSELDNGRKQLQEALEQLKIYRQSVLKWAFEGRLTNKKVKDGVLPEGWRWVRLGEILSVSSGDGIKVNQLTGGDYPVYGGNGINGFHTKYNVEEEKLIIGRVGAKCGVTHITKPKSWVTDNALVVNFKINNYNLKFFQLKLEFENLNKLSVATAQPVISGINIYSYDIMLPGVAEQNIIVQEIESRLSVADKMEESITTALKQTEILRQSILKKAFEGRLV